ncbi:MAG: chorismate synthase [Pseudomonadota bacterium]
MAGNSFGRLFRFTTWGESHGAAIGCVVDGVPPRLTLTREDIQRDLDRRRPGTSRLVSQRREPDQVMILSGVLEDQTTGTPIHLQIANQDARSKDYDNLAQTFRPGHADYSYWMKYGIADVRGGGRSSARETASRVAAGAVAKAILGAFTSITIRGAVVQIGTEGLPGGSWDEAAIDQNPLFCPDADTAKTWQAYLEDIRKKGSSVGAVVEVRALGMPAGLGEPIYDKLDSDLARAMMTINAVKGVEIGDGFTAASRYGEDGVDLMRGEAGEKPVFTSNHAGGVLGGISTGQDLIVRMAVKPTSSVPTTRDTINRQGRNTTVQTKGRHDPCVGIRAVPVGEAMMACVLADHVLRARATGTLVLDPRLPRE